ncbi:zeta toxin family protein [Hydrogenophaga taeniospiralis]|nr:zeta toxin family protein [Hydrogenophaga taeniospiralis]
MGGNAAVIDPDDLRSAHPDARNLRDHKPYIWSGETHSDAGRWAQELRADAVAQRKNLVLDTTMPRAREWLAWGQRVMCEHSALSPTPTVSQGSHHDPKNRHRPTEGRRRAP